MDTLPLEMLDHMLQYAIGAPVSISMVAVCLMTSRDFAHVATVIMVRVVHDNHIDDPHTISAARDARVAYADAVYDDAIINGYTGIMQWFAGLSRATKQAYYTAVTRHWNMLDVLDSLHDPTNIVNDLAITLINNHRPEYERIMNRYPQLQNNLSTHALMACKYENINALNLIKRNAAVVFDDHDLREQMTHYITYNVSIRVSAWLFQNNLVVYQE